MNSSEREPDPLVGDLKHVLLHTQGLWEELQGTRVFITGGTGFFGCWFLETLLYANAEYRLNVRAAVLTRQPAAFKTKAPHLANAPEIELVEGDVRSFSFPSGEFPTIIHAAAPMLAGPSAQETFETIVSGTKHVLEFATSHGGKKLLFVSSGSVYGKQPPGLAHLAEEHSADLDLSDPHAAYGEGKRCAELLCALYAPEHNLQTKIARCFAFVGPYLELDAHFAIGNFIGNRLRHEPICVTGDGSPYRSYLYAADLAIWLWTILFKGQPCRPYNVGSEDAVNIRDLAQLVAFISPPPLSVNIAEQEKKDVIASRYVPSTRRAREELGLQQQISLREAIIKTLFWHEEVNQRKSSCGQ
jgi:nucleoside-diphosphate-sugar epimerase